MVFWLRSGLDIIFRQLRFRLDWLDVTFGQGRRRRVW
jgi:hypothetical protein